MPDMQVMADLIASRWRRALEAHVERLERAVLPQVHGQRVLIALEEQRPGGWKGLTEDDPRRKDLAQLFAIRVIRALGEGRYMALLIRCEDEEQLAFEGHLQRENTLDGVTFRMVAL